MANLSNRVERLEEKIASPSAKCRHVISITNEGEPIPLSLCTADCPETHVNVVIVEPRAERKEREA
jgi:hypothetical protein